MACNLTTGINSISDCKTAIGGISEFYIANSSSIGSITEGTTGVTAITMVAEKKFFLFKPDKKSSFWSQSTIDSASGNIVPFEQTATMVFSKNDSSTINTIKMLAASYLTIIVKSKNGNFYLLNGTDNEGLELVSGSEYQSGTLISDSAAWTLVFKGEAIAPALIVDGTIIDNLLTT